MKKYLFSLLLTLSLFNLQAQDEWRLNAPANPDQREVRAVWLTTLNGLDWPRFAATSKAGETQQREELRGILDRLQRAGINTVLFQTRVRSTTAYPSAIEPWDGAFTGTPGRAPGYDPLAFALEECHRRGMELHAWVVAFPICKVPAEKKLGSRSLPRRRPDLCQKCGDQWMMDPGVPGTADYLANICREIVEKYDVDGIHLDYIRYPERGIPFNDTKTYRKYGAKRNKNAWRRDNVTRCVRAIHDAVKSVRPWVKLSCSPVGKYADLPRQSSYGWNARDAVHQDAQGWLRDGLMDMLFPMMYFDGKHFYPFAVDWQEKAGGKPVVPGLGTYFLSPKEKNWHLSVIRRQLNFLREQNIGGQAFFRSKFLTDNVKGLYDFVADEFYSQPAQTPAMTWLDSTPPAAPQPRLSLSGKTVRLTWQPVADATPIYYNVYRATPTDTVRLAMKLRATEFDHLPLVERLQGASYAVTAVDAYGNESAAHFQPSAATPKCDSSAVATVGNTLELPDVETAEFVLITDLTGRQLITRRYAPQVDIAPLPTGYYEARTLDRRGRSHRVAFFRKK